MKRYAARLWASFLTLSLLLSLAACGSGATAATMHLVRTQGAVSVSDGDGKDVPILDGLGLYSGYGVDTGSASYAWINLDDVKLAKLDQASEIAIQKEGKALDIEVRSGSLFFNVTEPLEDDETLNIRTSTMLIGVRGTCGWVEDRNGLSRVYLLEGKVECSAEDQTVQVSAGEMGALTADGELTVAPFPAETVPAFVRSDLPPDLIDGLGGAPESTPAAEPDPTLGTETVLSNGRYYVIEDGVLTFTYGEGEAVVIPDGVTGIGKDACMFDDGVTSVTIPDSVTSIGPGAFQGCANLTAVTIGNSVTDIGEKAFYLCGSLTAVTIPDSVISIGDWAFEECGGLTSVTIGNGVTSIGDWAFRECGSLTSVTIGNSVTSIGDSAFSKCGSLTGVVIPDSVTSIGDDAFTWCAGLTGVTIGNGVTAIGKETFAWCDSLSSVTIGNSVTSIGEGAFEGYNNLTSVTIPNGVTSIGRDAFFLCTNLTSVTIPGSVTSIGYSAFDACHNLTDVYYGGSEAQWNQIDLDYNNFVFPQAVIHFNS